MDFRKTLTDTREKAGLSQWELSRKTGISRGLLSLVETGKRTPPLDCLIQLMDALNLTGQDRQAFTQAAYLAHAPGEVRALVNHMRLDLAKSRQEATDLRSQVAGLTTQLSASSGQLSASKAEVDALRRDFRALLSVVRERGIKLPKGLGDG